MKKGRKAGRRLVKVDEKPFDGVPAALVSEAPFMIKKKGVKASGKLPSAGETGGVLKKKRGWPKGKPREKENVPIRLTPKATSGSISSWKTMSSRLKKKEDNRWNQQWHQGLERGHYSESCFGGSE